MIYKEDFLYADLYLVFAYLEKYCKGSVVSLTLDSDNRKLQIDTCNTSLEQVRILVTCRDAGMVPRIIKEDRLTL